VYWNHRLFMLTGDVKYYDVLERTLYNGLISGISLDGQKFFYPNALESDGIHTFNQGSCTRKSWFDCSCCPTNLIRFIPSVPGLIYSTHSDTVFVNLYASNEADVEIGEQKIQISQSTSYPWNGKVNIKINTEEKSVFTLKLRVPGWFRNEVLPGDLYSYKSNSEDKPSLILNGESFTIDPENGYYTISRKWTDGDEILLDFPMNVRMTTADDRVEDDRGKSSIEYGPLVYCVEEIDHPVGLDELQLSNKMNWTVKKDEELLEGINVISGTSESDKSRLMAIPYYSWSNRGVGAMKVWLPFHE